MEHSICPGVRGRRWAEACELSDRDHLEWRSMTYAVHHEKTFPWSLEEAMETEPLNLREAQGTHLPRPNPTSSSSNRTRTGTKTRAGLLAQALHRPDLREPVKIHTNLKKHSRSAVSRDTETSRTARDLRWDPNYRRGNLNKAAAMGSRITPSSEW
jgi:hypothetical protein